MTTIRRNLKNVVYNFTDAEVKVREATSNDPWGPPGTVMNELADMTHSVQAYAEIMSMLWKRLNDHGKNWRHVYKSLVLLDYLVKNGSDRVVRQCQDNIFSIQTLKDFQYLDKDGKDQGVNVREKAKGLVSLLKDSDRLKEEREKAKQSRLRMQATQGVSSDFGKTNEPGESRYGTGRSSASPVSPGGTQPISQAQPGSNTDEDLQLQLALRISKEEAEKDAKLRNQEEESLKAVLALSKQETVEEGPPAGEPQQSSAGERGSFDDLLDLDFGSSNGTDRPPPPDYATLLEGGDPWGGSTTTNGTAAGRITVQSSSSDPWGLGPATTSASTSSAATTTQPPLSGSTSASLQQQPDPWASPIVPAIGLPTTSLQPDPWNSSSNDDIFAGLEPVSPNPFNLQDLGNDLPPLSGDVYKPTRIEDDFLGDLAALVDLNTLNSQKPSSSVPVDSNPFAVPSYGGPPPANPFQQPKPRQPTLDELQRSKANPSGQLLPPPLLSDDPWQAQPQPPQQRPGTQQAVGNPFF